MLIRVCSRKLRLSDDVENGRLLLLSNISDGLAGCFRFDP